MEEIYISQEWKYEDYKKLAINAKDDIVAIRADIFGQVSNDQDLAALNSTSRTAIWQLIIDVVAFVMWLLHANWIRYEQKLRTAAANAIPHTARWYAQKAKEFQLGDSLTAATGVVVYPVLDISKQIVKQSAVREQNGKLLIKAAKATGANIVPLSAVELMNFEGYMRQISDAGVQIICISAAPDLLQLRLDIYYNAIVSIEQQVFAAINQYLSALPFDGVFRKTGLVDAIQSVLGVVDVKIIVCEASINYVSAPQFIPVDVYYETIAGYMRIDANFPLVNQLNFIANV
jgi:hypothetical protein